MRVSRDSARVGGNMPYPYIFAALIAVSSALLVVAAFTSSVLLISIASMIAGAGFALMVVDQIEIRRLIRERRVTHNHNG